MKSLLDYYRCPQRYLDCLEQSKANGTKGYFRFGSSMLFGHYRSAADGELGSKCIETVNHLTMHNSKCYLPFDVDEVAINLREERYVADGDVNRSYHGNNPLRRMYYLVRPWLGVGIRKHLQRLALRGRELTPFPSWPVDRTVDRMFERLLLLAMQTLGVEKVPFIWFWPNEYRGCAIMTHDVETARGLAFCPQLMDLDDSYGVKSSFQLIPSPERYAIPDSLVAKLRDRNFEINVHDWNHDGLLYSDHRTFCERAKAINQSAELLGAEGFRSGALYRNPSWYDLFHFAYDMSIPNVGHFDPQPGGCCTVMPYFIGNILELPVTVTQDYTLFHIRRDYSIALWEQQLATIVKGSGLANFIVHPDYLCDSRALVSYTRLLERLSSWRTTHHVWIARPGEVNQWWRQRSHLNLVERHGDLMIEGPGHERASLAYARSDGHNIIYELQEDARSHVCTRLS